MDTHQIFFFAEQKYRDNFQITLSQITLSTVEFCNSNRMMDHQMIDKQQEVLYKSQKFQFDAPGWIQEDSQDTYV